MLLFGIAYKPVVRDPSLSEHLTVRHLDLHVPDMSKRDKAGSEIAFPGPHHEQHTPSPGGNLPALRKIAQAEPGPQTLVQPDLPKPVKLEEKIPVPTIVIWTPKKTLAKTLIAPLPPKLAAIKVNPNANPPNEEINLADLSVSSTTSRADARLMASTTSPMVVRGPDHPPQPPATASQTAAQPTPTAVMSISDVQMKEGTVNLPPVSASCLHQLAGNGVAGKDGRFIAKRQGQRAKRGVGSWKWKGCRHARRCQRGWWKAAWRQARFRQN